MPTDTVAYQMNPCTSAVMIWEDDLFNELYHLIRPRINGINQTPFIDGIPIVAVDGPVPALTEIINAVYGLLLIFAPSGYQVWHETMLVKGSYAKSVQ